MVQLFQALCATNAAHTAGGDPGGLGSDLIVFNTARSAIGCSSITPQRSPFEPFGGFGAGCAGADDADVAGVAGGFATTPPCAPADGGCEPALAGVGAALFPGARPRARRPPAAGAFETTPPAPPAPRPPIAPCPPAPPEPAAPLPFPP